MPMFLPIATLWLIHWYRWHHLTNKAINLCCNEYTVETPYNTAPYIKGSSITRLGHGSQNSWSKLWIPIVKSAPVRVIFTRKSVPNKSIHGSSDIYLGPVARLPVVLPFRCHCHLPLLWHNRHYMTPWSSIHDQEGLIDANCICLRFTGTWAYRHRHPVDSCLQARWTRSVLPIKITQRVVETLNQF